MRSMILLGKKVCVITYCCGMAFVPSFFLIVIDMVGVVVVFAFITSFTVVCPFHRRSQKNRNFSKQSKSGQRSIFLRIELVFPFIKLL